MSVTLYVKDQPSTVMGQLYRLYKENILCDTAVLSRHGHVLCHSLVLSCIQPECLSQMGCGAAPQSPVWHQCTSLQAFSAEVVQVVLDFMYTGQIVIFPHTALDLVEAFQRFGLHLAVELCQKYLDVHTGEQRLVAPDFVSKDQTVSTNTISGNSLRPQASGFYDIRIKNGQLERSTLSKTSESGLAPLSKAHWYTEDNSSLFIKPHKRYAWEKWNCSAGDDLRGRTTHPTEPDSHRMGLECYGSALMASQNPESLSFSSHLAAISDNPWQDTCVGPEQAGHLVPTSELYKRLDFPEGPVSSSEFNSGVSCVNVATASHCLPVISDAAELPMQRPHGNSVTATTTSSSNNIREHFTAPRSHSDSVETSRELNSGKHRRANQAENSSGDDFTGSLLNLPNTSKPSHLYDNHKIKKYLLHCASGSTKFCNLSPVTSAASHTQPSTVDSVKTHSNISLNLPTSVLGFHEQSNGPGRYSDKVPSVSAFKTSNQLSFGRFQKAQSTQSTHDSGNMGPDLSVDSDPDWLCELCGARFQSCADRDSHQQPCAELALPHSDTDDPQVLVHDLNRSVEKAKHQLQFEKEAHHTSDRASHQLQSAQIPQLSSDIASHQLQSAQKTQHESDRASHQLQFAQIAQHSSDKASHQLQSAQLTQHSSDRASHQLQSAQLTQHSSNRASHQLQSAQIAQQTKDIASHKLQTVQVIQQISDRASYQLQPTKLAQHTSRKASQQLQSAQITQHSSDKASHQLYSAQIARHTSDRASHQLQSAQIAQCTSDRASHQLQSAQITQRTGTSDIASHQLQSAQIAQHTSDRASHQLQSALTTQHESDRASHQLQSAQISQHLSDKASHHLQFAQIAQHSSDKASHQLQSAQITQHTSGRASHQLQSAQIAQRTSDGTVQQIHSVQMNQQTSEEATSKLRSMPIPGHASLRASFFHQYLKLPNNTTDQSDRHLQSVQEAQHHPPAAEAQQMFQNQDGQHHLPHNTNSYQEQSVQSAEQAPERTQFYQRSTQMDWWGSEGHESLQLPALNDEPDENNSHMQQLAQMSQFAKARGNHSDPMLEMNDDIGVESCGLTEQPQRGQMFQLDTARGNGIRQPAEEMNQHAFKSIPQLQQAENTNQVASDSSICNRPPAETVQHEPPRARREPGKTAKVTYSMKAGKVHPGVQDSRDKQDILKEKKLKKVVQKSKITAIRDPNYPYSCTHCNNNFKRESEQLRHLRHKHGVPFPRDGRHTILCCEKEGCDFETLHASTLRVHLKRHDSDKPYLCDSCGKAFKSSYGLKQHSTECPDHAEDRSVPCDLCGKVLKGSINLKNHMSRLHRGKQHRCSQCPYASYSRSNLAAHSMAKHRVTLSNKQKMNCPYCEWATTSQSSLKSHIRRHTGESVANCDVCGKGFPDKKSLTSHRKWHKAKRSCPCPYDGCKYVAAVPITLKRHIHVVHTHKDEKPYACEVCPYRSNIQGNLRAHMLTRHKIKIPTKHRLLRVGSDELRNANENIPIRGGSTEDTVWSGDRSGMRVETTDSSAHVEEPKQSNNISLLNLDTLDTMTYASDLDPAPGPAAVVTGPLGSQSMVTTDADQTLEQHCPSSSLAWDSARISSAATDAERGGSDTSIVRKDIPLSQRLVREWLLTRMVYASSNQQGSKPGASN